MIDTIKQKLIDSRKYRGPFFVLLFAGIGGAILIQSKAATPSVSVEPEIGTVSGNAIVFNDSSASGGKAIKYSGPSPPPPTVKPPLQGLYDRGYLSPKSHPGSFSLPVQPYLDSMGGAVVNVRWSDLQLTQGGAVQRGAAQNQLDSAIAVVNSYNNAHPSHHIYLKLRIFAGTQAPDWAKQINGFAPVNICSEQTTTACGTVGPFWRSDYGTAYQDFVQKLATIYDTESLLREVTISQCMTIYAEPFQRDNSGFTQANLPGYSTASDKACLRQEVDGYTVWRRTRSSLAFNPYKTLVLQPDGTYANATTADETFTASVMDYCRQKLGTRCTLENNSIRVSTVGKENVTGTLYHDMIPRGPNLTFQTAGFNRLCGTPPCSAADLQTTIQWAINVKANALELPSGYTALALQTFSNDNSALISNPTK